MKHHTLFAHYDQPVFLKTSPKLTSGFCIVQRDETIGDVHVSFGVQYSETIKKACAAFNEVMNAAPILPDLTDEEYLQLEAAE